MSASSCTSALHTAWASKLASWCWSCSPAPISTSLQIRSAHILANHPSGTPSDLSADFHLIPSLISSHICFTPATWTLVVPWTHHVLPHLHSLAQHAPSSLSGLHLVTFAELSQVHFYFWSHLWWLPSWVRRTLLYTSSSFVSTGDLILDFLVCLSH